MNLISWYDFHSFFKGLNDGKVISLLFTMSYFLLAMTECGGLIGRAHTCVREVGSLVPSQVKLMMHNINMLLPSLAFGITRIGQGLVSSVSG